MKQPGRQGALIFIPRRRSEEIGTDGGSFRLLFKMVGLCRRWWALLSFVGAQVLYCIVYCWTEEEGSSAVAAGVRAGGLPAGGLPLLKAEDRCSTSACCSAGDMALAGEDHVLVSIA